jgi:RND superfamily putative drug exporter
MRLAGAVLLLALAAFPLGVLPAPPVTWLVVAALLVAGVGVAALSVPLVTAGASVALVAHALALAIVRPPPDLVAGVGLGATLLVLISLVHFAGRVRGAELARPVVAAQLRQWVTVLALGALAAVALTLGGSVLGAVLAATTLPVVVGAAALGALLAVAGAVVLLTSR